MNKETSRFMIDIYLFAQLTESYVKSLEGHRIQSRSLQCLFVFETYFSKLHSKESNLVAFIIHAICVIW